MGSLIRELQAAAAQTRIPVAELLRHTKMAAKKLGAEPAFLEWVERELRGYGEGEAIPDYRKIISQVSGADRHGHERKLVFNDPKSERVVQTTALNQPLSELEYAVKSAEHSEIGFLLGAATAQELRKSFPHLMVFFRRANVGAVDHILNRVREIILDWALELEAAGVLGEDMSFSEQEKEKAQPVTPTIYAQNVVMARDIGAGASLFQQATTTAPVDLAQVAAFLHDVREALGRLPPDEREVAEANIAIAEAELASPAPREGKIRAALKSVASTIGSLALKDGAAATWAAIKAWLFND